MQPVHPPRWQGYTLMRGPLGTTGPQASPCGCTIVACVMHCQLPGSDASCGAACSPSQEARGKVNRLHLAMLWFMGAGSASHKPR